MSKTNIPHKAGHLDRHSEEILQLLNDGVAKKAISVHFNVSPKSFYNWLQRRDVRQVYNGIETNYVFGEDSQNPCEKNKEKILEWHKAGITTQEITKMLGLRNANSVGQYIRRWKEEQNV